MDPHTIHSTSAPAGDAGQASTPASQTLPCDPQQQKTTGIWSKIWGMRWEIAIAGGLLCLWRGIVKRDAHTIGTSILLVAYGFFWRSAKNNANAYQTELPVKNALLHTFVSSLPKVKPESYEQALALYEEWSQKYITLKKELSLTEKQWPDHGIKIQNNQIEVAKKTIEDWSTAAEKAQDGSQEKEDLVADLSDAKVAFIDMSERYIVALRESIETIRTYQAMKLKLLQN